MPEGPLGLPRPFVPTYHVSLLKLGGDEDNVKGEPSTHVLMTMDEDMDMSEELLDRVDEESLRALENLGVVEDGGMIYDYIYLENLSPEDVIGILEGVQNTPEVDEVKFISTERLVSGQGPLGLQRPFVSTEQISFLEISRDIEDIDKHTEYPAIDILYTVDSMDLDEEVVRRIDHQFVRANDDMEVGPREEDGTVYRYVPLDELQLDDVIVLLEAVQETQPMEARFVSQGI